MEQFLLPHSKDFTHFMSQHVNRATEWEISFFALKSVLTLLISHMAYIVKINLVEAV